MIASCWYFAPMLSAEQRRTQIRSYPARREQW
jgi:hypothetical protein